MEMALKEPVSGCSGLFSKDIFRQAYSLMDGYHDQHNGILSFKLLNRYFA